MPAKGLQAELAMHEYDGITSFEEIFGRCCTSGTSAEIIEEADDIELQRYGGPSARYKHDRSISLSLPLDKLVNALYIGDK